ncbi:MAG: methyl-accepting chemotaxis protein, partial [Schwartzia sp.]|nr:methyl-accepting chemotaxis protein [Schwartzia sp. (in: firmicutes)]
MMKWLDDIRVAYKLAILAVVTVVGMMIIGGSGYFAIKKAQADMETMYASSVQTLVYIGAANGDMRRAQAMAASAIVSANDPARVKKLTNSLQESLKAVEASIKKLDEIPGKNADAVALLEKIKKDYNELKPILERTLEYVAAGQSQSAGEYYTKNGASRASAIGKELAQLTQLQADIAKQLNEQNDADTERTIRFMVIELIVFLAISVVAVLIITKKITTPLELMTNALVKLRDGDFIITQRTIQRDDEFGALANMVADVRKSLNRLMRDTNASAEQLAAASEELTASSQQAAQASSMVANSVTDAAGATAEQQTYVNDAMESINNTAESVERLNQTAETVSQHASESKDEAEAGSKAIQQAVEQI